MVARSGGKNQERGVWAKADRLKRLKGKTAESGVM